MIQTVVKRDGRIVGFNEQKIMAAIRKAMLHTDKGEDERLLFPGELTLILKQREDWRHPYFDNFHTVGIRIPNHEYMLDLLRETGPLLVTSANPRGEEPCRTSRELNKRMPSVDLIVKGECGGDLPSTVIDITTDTPRPLRQGGLLIVHYS